MHGHWVDVEPRSCDAPRAGWLKAVSALAVVIFETSGGRPPQDRVFWLCAELNDLMARVGARSRAVFRLSLFVVGLVAPLLVLRPWPLRFMPPAIRARALERFERSPFGLSLFAVKAMLCIIYYEHPAAAAELGFEGLSLEERRAQPEAR